MAKGEVCKTFIQGFESPPRLQHSQSKSASLSQPITAGRTGSGDAACGVEIKPTQLPTGAGAHTGDTLWSLTRSGNPVKVFENFRQKHYHLD